MKKKVNLQFIGIAALAVISTLVLSMAIFYDLFKTQVLDDLKTHAYLLKQFVVSEDAGELVQLEDDGVRITLIGETGTVLFDSQVDVEELENHRDRPEVKSAFEKGEGQAIRRSGTFGKNTFYYAILMEEGRVLRVARNAGSIWSVLGSALPDMLFVLILIFVVCIVLARFMSKSLLSPIEQMAKDIDKIEEVKTYEELVPFIQTIEKQHQDIVRNANMRQEFTANVSHELKTPLTSISGYAELIVTGIASEADVIRFSREIKKNSTRLLTLINDILRLSELDAVDMGITFQEVNLYQVAETCVDMLQVNADNHGVTLELEGAHYTITANKQMIDELVYNLCDNAIRYNNPGGSVKVSIVRGVDGIVLSVKDTGIGIPIEYQDRIFERFYRVDKSRSKSTGGTGLGLAIVKHIVAQHNAQIELFSEVDGGTEITVTFQ